MMHNTLKPENQLANSLTNPLQMCRSGNTALQAQGKDSLITGFGVHSQSLQTSASGSSSSSRPHQLAPPLRVTPDPSPLHYQVQHLYTLSMLPLLFSRVPLSENLLLWQWSGEGKIVCDQYYEVHVL